MRSAVMLVLLFGLSACGKSAPPLSLKVSQLGGEISITNLDKDMVHDCFVHINYDWKVSNVTLLSGMEKTIPMTDFVNGDGARFNAFTHKPSSILVDCYKPEHRSGEYGFR